MSFSGIRIRQSLTRTLWLSTLLSLLPIAAFSQEIDEIVVSVRKVDESLQEVPIAVNVFNEEYIAKNSESKLSLM